MCRSKSGGAHVFLFAKEPIKAKLVRDKLIEWAGELGYANCEIFPKQIEIKADRGDTGNFLNLPYHGGDDSLRYSFNDDGTSLNLTNFFDLYDQYCISEEDLVNFNELFKSENDDSLKEELADLLTNTIKLSTVLKIKAQIIYKIFVFYLKLF